MVAQSIRSLSVNTSNLKSTNSKKEVQGFSFDNIINNNLKANDKTEKQVSKKQPREKLSESKRYSEDTNIRKTSGTLDKTTNVKNHNEANKISQDIHNSTNVEAETAKALKDLEDTVKKELNLTDKDFEEVMETLGLTVVDLLNFENLKQLFLKVNGTEDITEVLTSENLATEMDRLIQAVNELQESNEILLQADKLLGTGSADDLMKQGNIQNTNDKDPNISVESESKEVGMPRDVVEVVIGKEESVNLASLENNKQEEAIINVYSENQSLSNEEEGNFNSTNSNLLDENTMQDGSIKELIDGNSEQKEPKFEPLNDMNSFIHNLAAATLGKEYIGAEQVGDVRMIHDITNQILEHLKVSIKPDFTSMELQLNPEHLGKVGLTIVSKEGSLTAQFTTQNEMAKEAIESQMHILIENLNNQGLKVESIEVAVSNFTFGESNQTSKGEEQQNNSQNRNHFKSDEEILGNLDGVSGIKDIQSDILEQNGSIIDYSA